MSSTGRLEQAPEGRRTARAIGAWALLSVLCAACGGSVTVSQSGGTTGSGASSSTSGTGAGASGATSGSGAGGGAATGATSSSGAGGGAVCGSIAGIACPAGEYCDFPDKECGGNDGSGTCTPIPMACPTIEAPACGCDHKVYENGCYANAGGTDIDALGGCTPPAGMFGCGFDFCQLGAEYCELDTTDVATIPSTYLCKPIPAACGGAPSCACLSGVQCGTLCTTTPDGGLRVTCPGG